MPIATKYSWFQRKTGLLPDVGELPRYPVRKRMVSIAAVILIVLLAGYLLYSTHWFSRIFLQQSDSQLHLDRYRLQGQPIALTLMGMNASGLTYNRDTDTLFAVANQPESIVELTLQGEELRQIKLDGFEDTEGLVYLGEQRFAVLEERRRAVVVITIMPETTRIARWQGRGLELGFLGAGNKGFEGVAYDASRGALYIVNERSPRQIFEVLGLSSGAQGVRVSEPWRWEDNTLGVSDLSGLHFDAGSGRLLVLSDESASLTEVTPTGIFASRVSLRQRRAGFAEPVPQAEGVTMGADGTIYILSEPNLLYRLSPPAEPAVELLVER